MADSPTKRTLARIRDLGGRAEVVERWNPHSRTRHDLFGFVDIIALWNGTAYAIQATSTSNIQSRRTKVLTETSEQAIDWLRCTGGGIEVWGWRKYKKRIPDDRRLVRETILIITMEDFLT